MGDAVNTVGPGGAVIPRTAEDAAVLGATVQDPAVGEAALQTERRRKMFDNPVDAALTFSEGVVDAFFLGLTRETGEAADLRRSANEGYAMGGEAVGAALGLIGGGPVKVVAEAGETLGKAAAKAALRQGEKSVVTTALKEAGAGAALTGSTAFGHQLMDAVIEDRAFSGEAILDEAKLGGVVGLVGGGFMGTFKGLSARAASRANVAAQGGAVGAVDDVMGSFESARAGYGEALHFHEAQLGALRQFRSQGLLGDVSDDFLRVRSDAVRRARNAQQALRDMDVEAALSGSDPAAYKNLQRRWSEYTRAMEDVDDIMRPHPAEADAVAAIREPGTGVHPVMRVADDEVIPVVRGGEDFSVRASEVAEAIPDEAAYLSRYKSRDLEQVEGAPAKFPDGTPATGAQTPGAKRAAAAPAEAPAIYPSTTDFLAANPRNIQGDIAQMFKRGSKGEMIAAAREGRVLPPKMNVSDDLVALDDAIRKLPLRSADENASAMAASIDRSGTVVEAVPYGAVAKQMDAADAAAKTRVVDRAEPTAKFEKPPLDEIGQRLMDNWLDLAEPRIRPWHQAQTRAQAAMEALYQKSGGRLDSARGLGILEADGIRPSADSVGSYLDSVYAMNRASRFVADEARGVATPLRKAGSNAVNTALKLAGAKMLGVKGMGMMMGFLGYGGRLAAATGRLYRRVVDSVASFMTSTKVRGLAVTASNFPWAYSERGPIKDPVERIQEIQFLAQNPDAIRARVREQAGELFAAAPEHVKALEDRAIAQITALAMRAPAIYWDKLGRPLAPPQGKMRQFFEFENATNDLDAILRALKSGSLTRPQVEALQISWPAVHTRIVQGLLSDPAALQRFSREKLRTVEMVTGMSLTGASDPMFLARQQQGWAPMPQPAAQGTKQAAQSFKLQETPTPTQANAGGRAPGNY